MWTALFLASCILVGEAHRIGNARSNVLLIIADDLRPTLSCYGDPLAMTPSMDSLAKDGVLFTNAHAQVS